MSQHDGETSGDIGGFQYRVLMLDPLIAADIIADLGYILAPIAGAIGGVVVKEKGASLGSLLDGVKPDEALDNALDEVLEDGDEKKEGGGLSPDSAIDLAFERAVLGFFGRFTKAKQREIIDIMAKQTQVVMPDGKKPMLSPIFRIHFKGRVGGMYKWLAFAMKVQFQDFFTGADGDMSGVLDQISKAADLTT